MRVTTVQRRKRRTCSLNLSEARPDMWAGQAVANRYVITATLSNRLSTAITAVWALHLSGAVRGM